MKDATQTKIVGAEESLTELPSSTTVTVEPFFVVGIGASAGGLEALEQFFENVPEDFVAAEVAFNTSILSQQYTHSFD